MVSELNVVTISLSNGWTDLLLRHVFNLDSSGLSTGNIVHNTRSHLFQRSTL